MRNILFLMCFLPAISLSAQWVIQNSGTSAFLTNVFFPTADIGYITKDDGGVLKTTNGGNNWMLKNGANTAVNLYFISADTGIAVAGNTIKKTIDGGSSWIAKHTDSSKIFFLIFFVNKNTGFVIASDGNFNTYTYKTIDSGENWSIQGTSSLGSPGDVFFIDSNIGYLVTDVRIFKTSDGGINWTEQYLDSAAFTEIESIFFASSDTGYAVGGSIYTTFDAGATWSLQPTPDGNPLYSVFFLTKNVGFVVGGDGINSGSVYKTNDAGNTWFQSTPQVQTFNSVYFPDDTTGYVVGDNGIVIKYYNPDSVPLDTVHSNLVINPLAFKSRINLYPNPTYNGRLCFNLTDLEKQTANIIVTNILGESVYQLNKSENKMPLSIDLSTQPKGIYFVKISTREDITVQKIIYQ